MEEQKNNKDQEKTEEEINVLDVAVFDHLLIIDNETGKKIINKRG